jgi:hypothetical protein
MKTEQELTDAKPFGRRQPRRGGSQYQTHTRHKTPKEQRKLVWLRRLAEEEDAYVVKGRGERNPFPFLIADIHGKHVIAGGSGELRTLEEVEDALRALWTKKHTI